MKSNAVSLQKVGKKYRKSHLGKTTETIGLSSLDLTIARGEVYGLLGLNGSGKTTTIKLIMGLHLPTTGQVEVFGAAMPDVETLRLIGYAPESAYLNRSLTGREILNLFAALSRIPRDRRAKLVQNALEKFGLAKAADRRTSEYSKGMLQRISLAQALLHDPELVILDEPITGLDPLAVREVRELILWLKKQGKTVLFSSHDISEAERVCDRVGILSAGRLVRELKRKDWSGRDNALEEIFAAEVKRSDGVGDIHLR